MGLLSRLVVPPQVQAGWEVGKRVVAAIPRWVWIALAVLVLAWWIRHEIRDYGQAQYAKGRADLLAEQAKAAKPVIAQQAKVTERVVTKYVDRVRVIRERGATIVKEVPIYVPSDAAPLPGGFRLLHDAAAAGAVPDPAGIPDAAGVPAQDAAAVVAENYGTYHETAARLTALQDWVRQQQALNPAEDAQ